MIRSTSLLVLLLLCAFATQAGTYPFYYYFTQHTQNQLLYNPAYAGSTDRLNLHVRSMHGFFKTTGTRGALNILNHSYVAFDRPCKAIRGAWGAYAIIDRPETGAARYYNLSVGGNYAYRWQINEDHRLQFGAGINYRRHFHDVRGLVFADPNDPVLLGRYSNNHLDFSIGTWYQYKGLNAGISVTHFGNFYAGGKGDNIYGRYSPVFNLYAAYKLEMAEQVHVEPYLYLSSAQYHGMQSGWGEKAQFSAGLMADYNDAVFLGFGYSQEQVLSPSLGFQLKKMFRVQGTYNYLLKRAGDAGWRYHNFEVSFTMQLPYNPQSTDDGPRKKK